MAVTRLTDLPSLTNLVATDKLLVLRTEPDYRQTTVDDIVIFSVSSLTNNFIVKKIAASPYLDDSTIFDNGNSVRITTGSITNGTTAIAFGDSYTVGTTGPSDIDHSYIKLVAANKGWTITNNAVDASMAPDQADVIYAATPAAGSNYIYCLGVNDSRFYANTVAQDTIYRLSTLAELAWLSIENSSINKQTGQGGSITYTGSWSNTTLYSGSSLGKNNATNGSTATAYVYGKNVLVAYTAKDSNGGQFTITIDGTSYGTFNCYSGGTISSLLGRTYTPYLAAISNLTDTKHTVVITVSSATAAGNIVYLDWIAGTDSIIDQNGPNVFVLNVSRVTDAAYVANGGSLAQTARYNQILQNNVSYLASMGLNVVMGNIFGVLDVTADFIGDGIHPDDSGHAKMAQVLEYISNSISYPIERQIGTLPIANFTWTPSTLSIYTENSGWSEKIRVVPSGNLAIGLGNTTALANLDATTLSAIDFTLGSKTWRTQVFGNDFYITEFGVGHSLMLEAGGNVGVGGVSDPTECLDIGLNLRLRGALNMATDSIIYANTYYDGALKYRANGYANHILFDTTASGSIQFRNAVSGVADAVVTFGTVFTIANNGSQTINITARTTVFDATDLTTWGDIYVRNPVTTTAGVATGIVFENHATGNVNAGTGIAAVKSDTTDYGSHLVFITRPQSANSAERMRITNAGNVGIGTAAPDGRLTISDGINDTETIMTFKTDVNPATGAGIYSTGAIASGFTTQAYTGAYLDLKYATAANTYSTGLRLINGNVGIGTTAPDAKLEVNLGTSGQFRLSYNDADGSAANYAKMEVSSAGLLTVTTVDAAAALGHIALMPDGNVGIGINSPASKLHVVVTSSNVRIDGSPDGNGLLHIRPSSGSAGYITFAENDVNNRGAIGFAAGDGDMNFITGGLTSVKMVIDSTGNVGIGTTAPDKKVEINLGTADALRLTYNDANGSATVYSDFTLGSTGIMTITPVGTASAIGMGARFMQKQGADVASATNLTLGIDGNVFELTGTTKVDLISNVGWINGSTITLIANESVVIDDGTATSGTNITIVLAGGVDYSMTADDTLTLVLSETTAGGVAWREINRSVN